MKNRADINGLRAVAVLPIVIFHLRTSIFTGGFVGVDIFYVISGFLIGGGIFEQIARGQFSILHFYERRFRRILPALLAMLAGVTIAGLFILYPPALADYAKSMVAAILSVSNFYFWQVIDYFGPGAYEQPLLHTWSLGVEEQFYILFPLLMLGLARLRPAWTTPLLITIALLSFGLSIPGVFVWPIPTFYLLPSRAWEILLGALVARADLHVFDDARIRQSVALVAMVMIAVPIVLYTEAMPFPGLAALPPCLGTALLISTGARGPSWVGKALSWTPMVWIGLISYSLYLWHWPVIVLMQEWLPATNLGKIGKIVAFLLSLGLGWLSWYFVEQPLRKPSVSSWTIFRMAGLGIGGITALGVGLIVLHGLPQRYPAQVARVASFLAYKPIEYREGRCQLQTFKARADFDDAYCLARSATKPNILVLGDSHAAHLWWGLHRRYGGDNVMQATASGCKPTLRQASRGTKGCVDLMTDMLTRYIPAHPGDQVIISANWTQEDAATLQATLAGLRNAGAHVTIAGPIVKYDNRLPQLLALERQRGSAGLVVAHRIADVPMIDQTIGAVATRNDARFVSLYRYICPSDRCVTTNADGSPIQFDSSHLTAQGSELVAGAFARARGGDR